MSASFYFLVNSLPSTQPSTKPKNQALKAPTSSTIHMFVMMLSIVMVVTSFPAIHFIYW